MAKMLKIKIDECRGCPHVEQTYPEDEPEYWRPAYCTFGQFSRRVPHNQAIPSWCPLPEWKEEEK